MDNKVILAILAVAVIIAAGAVCVFTIGGSNAPEKEPEKEPVNDPHEITVKDSLGNDVTLTVPLTKICTVNTNAAEFLHMFGASDRVVAVDSSLRESMPAIYGKATDVGDYKTPAGDKIIETGATVVISQSSSRSLSAATEQALKDNYGITVLRIDCYGENMASDIETLVKVLDSTSAEKKLNEYRGIYNDIVAKVLAKAKDAHKDPAFLMMFTSMNKFYNDNSELCKIVEKIGGHNSLVDMGDKPSKSSVTSAPSKETVYNNGMTNGTDLVLIRGISGSTAESCYQKFLAYGGTYDFTKLDKGNTSDIYVIETDVLSGPRDYVGYVCIAESMGIDTGLDYDKLVNEFNTKYGFGVIYPYIMSKFPA